MSSTPSQTSSTPSCRRRISGTPLLFRSTLLALSMTVSAAGPGAAAQTCRVNLGVNADGQRAYMEVYEYDFVSEKPSFPGGDDKFMEFINAHRQYPARAYESGVQGRVTCSFVVNSDGAVSHLRVIKSVEDSLNEEALRILALMPAWTPGRLNGIAVPVRVIRSVPFRR